MGFLNIFDGGGNNNQQRQEPNLNPGQQQNQQQQQQKPLTPDQILELDDDSAFMEFMNTEDDDDDESNGGGDKKKTPASDVDADGKPKKKEPTQEEQAMVQQISRLISGINPADDFKDIDMSDPTAFAGALGKAMQKNAQVSIQAAMIPLQGAMQQMLNDVRTEIQSAVQNGFQQNNQNTALSRLGLDVNHPMLGTMIKETNAKAMKKFKGDPEKAAQATLRSIQGLGIDLDSMRGKKGKSSSMETDSDGGVTLSGSNLDKFFGNFK